MVTCGHTWDPKSYLKLGAGEAGLRVVKADWRWVRTLTSFLGAPMSFWVSGPQPSKQAA